MPLILAAQQLQAAALRVQRIAYSVGLIASRAQHALDRWIVRHIDAGGVSSQTPCPSVGMRERGAAHLARRGVFALRRVFFRRRA